METVVYTLFAIGGAIFGIYAIKLAVDMFFADMEQEGKRNLGEKK